MPAPRLEVRLLASQQSVYEAFVKEGGFAY
jgi:hypothetical protein